MKTIFKIISFTGLGLTLIPSFAVYLDKITWDTHAILMIFGMVIYFLSAPFWMKRKV